MREDDRIELIEGEMIELAPIVSRHPAKVNRLARLLSLQIGEHAIVLVQNPIALPPHNEPQPDIALLTPRAMTFQPSFRFLWRHIPFALTLEYLPVTSKKATLLSSGFILRHSTGNTFRWRHRAFSHGSYNLGLCFVGSHFTRR